jgi:hypothetical protein
MDEIEIYATAIITILSIAYPLIIQVISKLEDTYGSTRIIDLFEKEPVRKWFPVQLYIALFSVFLWSLKLKPLPLFSDLGFVARNSGSLFVMLNTVLLVISFVLLVNKLVIFSTASNIVKYLIEKHNERH